MNPRATPPGTTSGHGRSGPRQAPTADLPHRGAPARRHDLDWLRAVAVFGVFVFHAAHPFDLFDWHVKNDQRSFALTLLLGFFSPWGMGLMFLLAGAASRLALRSRTAGQYLAERWRRLAVPFLAGSVLLSPVQGYVEAVHRRRWTGSFLAFVPGYWRDLAGRVPSSGHGVTPAWFGAVGYHLWFLGFLLACSAAALPLFRYLESDRGRRLVARVAAWSGRSGGALLFAAPLVLSQAGLRAIAPDEHDWADFASYLAFFVAGYVLTADWRLKAAVRRDGPVAAVVGVAAFAALVATDFPAWLQRWLVHPGYSWDYLLMTSLFAVDAWSWTVAAVSLGMRSRRFQAPLPRSIGELALPFYVLHQPVILVIALFVVQARAGVPVKLALVLGSSFVATAGLCLVLVRTRGLRRALGVKPSTEPASSDR
jgi:glucans biosynthesis protein C